MTKSELKQYLLDNRNDKEALKELKSRPKQNVITIPANIDTAKQEEILKQAISNVKSR
ncbi:MAG: hypothetical protein AAFQ14_10450 [Cyanobacteria bacterium J06621_12]